MKDILQKIFMYAENAKDLKHIMNYLKLQKL